MIKSTAIISALLVLIISVNSCQPNYQLQNIQTGTFNFQNTQTDQTSDSPISYRYPYFTKFPQTPQIAFAINNLQNQNVELPSFYISIKNKNNSQVQFLLVQYQSWNLITINYIIALRNDIYLDSNHIDLTRSVNHTYLLEVKKTINPYKSIARVFLNGFVLLNPTGKEQRQYVFDIVIDVNQILQKSIQVTLQGTTIRLTKNLWFSFLIFEPQIAGFASYGGRISRQNFQGIESSNLHQIIYRSQYKLFGLNGIQLKEKSLALISSINSDFVGTVYSNGPIASLTIDFIILGVPPNRMCNCVNSTLKYAFLDQCLSVCPNDSYVYEYKEGVYACLKCRSILNMKLNSDKSGCECNQGYELNHEGTRCVLRSNNAAILIFDETKPNITTDTSSLITTTTSEDHLNQWPATINPIPQAPTSIPLPTVQISNPQASISISFPTVQVSNACASQVANTYFDGTTCYCKHGYKNVSNSCIQSVEVALEQKLITPISLIMLNNSSVVEYTCPGQKQIFINGQCQCQIGFQRVDNTCLSRIPGVCTQGQYWNGKNCTCLTGFVRNSNNLCISQNSQPFNCSENQVSNGLGLCVCKTGYYNVSGRCISDRPCPLNSVRMTNGTCVCNSGFTNVSGQCSRCPQNQIWVQSESRCVTFCGLNAFYNQTTARCQCILNFGLSYNNICQYCPPDKFILKNYCVSCQINQFYNSTLKQCVCQDDYYMEKNGICVRKCANNQLYDKDSMSCKCQLTLGRFNSVCQICPENHTVSPVSQQCLACNGNQVFFDGACVCQSGFAKNQYGICVPCSEVSNTFIIEGKCATCPGQMIYNGKGCVCPFGTVNIGLKCVRKCNSDQLMSDTGNCFKCPINEVIMDGQCVCKSNYQRINSVCQLVCQTGAFLYQGRCAMCPQNKIYNTQIDGCVCQNGYYLNVYNQCVKLSFELQVNQCPAKKYLDSNFGCQDCSENCLNCTNGSNCVKCAANFLLLNGKCWSQCGNGFVGLIEECDDQNILNGDGCSSSCKIETSFNCSGVPSKCVPLLQQVRCGNGMIETREQCDDSNTVNGDGCSSSCLVQRLFSCRGQPSVCQYNATGHTCGNGFVQFSQQCDDANFNTNDGCDQSCRIEQGYACVAEPSICTKVPTTQLKLYADIKYNINNIYISLQTDRKYIFSSESSMQNFMKANYFNLTMRPSTYCQQREDPDLDIFDCLLLFSSGIPNRAFQAEFSYLTPTTGNSVRLVLDVDPLAGQIDKSRTLRRNW